jgi:hypothetical protein
VSTGKPRAGSQVLPTIIALIMVAVGLVTLNLGFASLSSNDLATAILYFSVAVVSFGFVSFSVLRVRRGFGFGYVSNSKVLSIVKCTQCSFKQIKNFTLGDFVFKQEGKCTQCGNQTLFINGIYSEDLRKR